MNSLVSAEEQARVARGICEKLNECENLPVDRVEYSYLTEPDCISVVTNSAAHVTRRYITGGYEAQTQFTIVYRVFANNNDERLQADEILDALAAWLEEQTVTVNYMRQKTLRRDTCSALSRRYENGAEDHEINMTLIYEV